MHNPGGPETYLTAFLEFSRLDVLGYYIVIALPRMGAANISETSANISLLRTILRNNLIFLITIHM